MSGHKSRFSCASAFSASRIRAAFKLNEGNGTRKVHSEVFGEATGTGTVFQIGKCSSDLLPVTLVLRDDAALIDHDLGGKLPLAAAVSITPVSQKRIALF